VLAELELHGGECPVDQGATFRPDPGNGGACQGDHPRGCQLQRRGQREMEDGVCG